MENNEPQSGKTIDLCLRLSTPMWLLEHKDKPYDFLKRRSEFCSQVIAEKGDVLMYGSKKAGAAADVFNRLAEGMACLLLITKHPVPFGKTVYYPDGSQKTFESEREANAEVWPETKKEMSKVLEGDHGALQPEEMPAVRGYSNKEATVDANENTNSGSKEDDRKNG